MGPIDVIIELRRIAATIDASENPQRQLVAADVRSVLATLDMQSDFKSGAIIDGIYKVLHGPDIGKSSTPFKVKGTSYKQINGFIDIGGETGSWFFSIEQKNDGIEIYGKINGEEYEEVFSPEENEDPSDFGERMITSLMNDDTDFKALYEGTYEIPSEKEDEPLPNVLGWEDEPLGGQPDPNH